MSKCLKTKVEDTGKKEDVVGHIPESLPLILGPILKDGTVHSITAKTTGEKHQKEFGFRVVKLNFLEILCLRTEGIQGASEEGTA